MTRPVRTWRVVAVVAAAVGLVIMVLPTWPMTWGLSYDEFLITYQAWWDPVLPGNASFGPPISLVLTLVGIVAAFTALMRPTRQRGPAWLFGWAAAVAVMDRVILSSVPSLWVGVAIATLLVASGASVLALREQRTDPL